MAVILEAKSIYSQIKHQLKNRVDVLGKIVFASIIVGENHSSRMYLSHQKKLAEELGIACCQINLSADISFNDFLRKIKKLNRDKKITGIIINKPFPITWKEEDVFSNLDAGKDIEGMNPYNLGMLLRGQPRFVSPTVRSIIKFIEISGLNVIGKDVTIVGASLLIGKPLTVLLSNMGATVSLTHIETFKADKLSAYVANADIVITAAGVAELVKGSWFKHGALAIDVGAGHRDGKMIGDIEFESACKRVSWITPVPGGVGRLTALFLMDNLILAAEYNNRVV